MRAIAIPGENTLTSSEFTKELYKLFRNSEDTKETLENISVSELLLNIQGNNELEKIAKKAYKELEKTIKEEIKDLDKAEKEMVKSMPESGELRGKQIRISNDVISLKKEKLNILNIVNGAKLTALKDANRQSKAICVALLNYKIVEKMRAIAIPGENTLTSSEFTKELYKLFRNSEDTKETLENISVSELLLNIQGNNELEKIAKKAYKELEKTIKEEIKDLDKAEKEMVKSMPESGELRGKQIRISNDVISLKKEKLNILNIVNGAKLTALKDANRQSKAICVALLNYKPKNEGYNFDDDDYVAESGFLGNVVLR